MSRYPLALRDEVVDANPGDSLEGVRRSMLSVPGVQKVYLTPGRGYVALDLIVVDPAERGRGAGSEAMRRLTRWADEQGVTLALTPTGDFGGSVRRLRAFYGRWGFRANTGRSRDHAISAAMIRAPRTLNRAGRLSPVRPGQPRSERRNGDRLSGYRLPWTGDGWDRWLRALEGRSGAYVIRDRRTGEVLYVGESHTGQLYDTITRHFQRWRGRSRRTARTVGHTYDRDDVEVAVGLTPPGRSIERQDDLIARLAPRDNETSGRRSMHLDFLWQLRGTGKKGKKAGNPMGRSDKQYERRKAAEAAARQVECPYCHAPPGKACGPFDTHIERLREAAKRAQNPGPYIDWGLVGEILDDRGAHPRGRTLDHRDLELVESWGYDVRFTHPTNRAATDVRREVFGLERPRYGRRRDELPPLGDLFSRARNPKKKGMTKKEMAKIAADATRYGYSQSGHTISVTCPLCSRKVSTTTEHGKRAGTLLRAAMVGHLTYDHDEEPAPPPPSAGVIVERPSAPDWRIGSQASALLDSGMLPGAVRTPASADDTRFAWADYMGHRWVFRSIRAASTGKRMGSISTPYGEALVNAQESAPYGSGPGGFPHFLELAESMAIGGPPEDRGAWLAVVERFRQADGKIARAGNPEWTLDPSRDRFRRPDFAAEALRYMRTHELDPGAGMIGADGWPRSTPAAALSTFRGETERKGARTGPCPACGHKRKLSGVIYDEGRPEAVCQSCARRYHRATNPRGSSKAPEAMAPAELERAIKAADAEASATGRALIDAGRGHERFSETRAAAGRGDVLAVQHMAASDRVSALRAERDRRLRYHGSLKRTPVPRASNPLLAVVNPPVSGHEAHMVRSVAKRAREEARLRYTDPRDEATIACEVLSERERMDPARAMRYQAAAALIRTGVDPASQNPPRGDERLRELARRLDAGDVSAAEPYRAALARAGRSTLPAAAKQRGWWVDRDGVVPVYFDGPSGGLHVGWLDLVNESDYFQFSAPPERFLPRIDGAPLSASPRAIMDELRRTTTPHGVASPGAVAAYLAASPSPRRRERREFDEDQEVLRRGGNPLRGDEERRALERAARSGDPLDVQRAARARERVRHGPVADRLTPDQRAVLLYLDLWAPLSFDELAQKMLDKGMDRATLTAATRRLNEYGLIDSGRGYVLYPGAQEVIARLLAPGLPGDPTLAGQRNARAGNPRVADNPLLSIVNPRGSAKDRGKVRRVSLREAERLVGAKAHQQAAAATERFHGYDPRHAVIYRYDDGKPGVTRVPVVGLGRPPETHYVTDGKRTNKRGRHWVHKHPPASAPLLVYDPRTGTQHLIGGTVTVTDWLRK